VCLSVYQQPEEMQNEFTCSGLILSSLTPPLPLSIHASSRLASEATTRDERPLVANWASLPAVALRSRGFIGPLFACTLVGGLCNNRQSVPVYYAVTLHLS